MSSNRKIDKKKNLIKIQENKTNYKK